MITNTGTRRQFFHDCGIGIGKMALASTLLGGVSREGQAAGAGQPVATPSIARAKRVIYLFMAGAPSQLDLFDYKPKLVDLDGQSIPPSVIKGQRYAFIQPDAAVLSPRFEFEQYGQTGLQIANIQPGLGSIADDIAFVRSVKTDQFNHAPGQLFFNTGSGIPGRPSMGSWLSYGLGSEADDLPAFVVLNGGGLSGGASMWSSGFLPSVHQGVVFRSQGDPILNLTAPKGISHRAQRETIDLVREMNQRRLKQIGDPEIQTRIDAYEMAFRMQTRAPELLDLRSESKATLDLYGVDPDQGKASFAKSCLMARRLVERGVRFVQVYESGWDHHSNVENGVKSKVAQTDRPAAALIKDLKMRGLLEDTLVIWGGEFGRTPMVEASAALGRKLGRDHHPQAFSMWFAGGGIKPGVQLGKTDDLGFHVVEDPIHVHDVQATILHLMGIDHERLTYRHQGRDFRLTDVHGHVVSSLLA